MVEFWAQPFRMFQNELSVILSCKYVNRIVPTLFLGKMIRFDIFSGCLLLFSAEIVETKTKQKNKKNIFCCARRKKCLKGSQMDRG